MNVAPLNPPAQQQVVAQLNRLLQTGPVQQAREQTRHMLAHTPWGRSPEGGATLDRALDGWLARMAFDAVARALPQAHILWHNQLTPVPWPQGVMPAQAASIDNPDFAYRCMAFDGDAEYEVHGRVDAPAGRVVFQLTEEPSGREGFALQRSGMYDLASLATLLDQDMDIRPDGSFTLTLGPSLANGRRNHLQTPPRRLLLLTRSIFTEWHVHPHAFEVRRLDGRPQSSTAPFEAVVQQVAGDLVHHAEFWCGYLDHMEGLLPAHQVVGPNLRNGAWSLLAFIRVALQEDEALLVHLGPTAAPYRGLQFADRWGVSPDPTQHLCSAQPSQSQADDDGGYRYVVSPTDPHTANWIDTGGLRNGFVAIRWVGLHTDGLAADTLVRGVRVVRTTELAEHLQGLHTIGPAERTEARRARGLAWRARAG